MQPEPSLEELTVPVLFPSCICKGLDLCAYHARLERIRAADEAARLAQSRAKKKTKK